MPQQRQSMKPRDHQVREEVARQHLAGARRQQPSAQRHLAGVRSAQRLAPPHTGPRPTAGELLALQRTVGNRAVGRLLERPPAPTQRLALSERPVNASQPNLVSIKPLAGGLKGDVYLLQNKSGQRLVVKFQNEDPKEAMLGTAFQTAAGVTTPRMRKAVRSDLAALKTGLGLLVAGDRAAKLRMAKLKTDFKASAGKFAHALLMDFAEGRSLKNLMETRPTEAADALRDPQFHADLGRMLAADALAGNADRAMAIKSGTGTSGWYNPNNILINKVQDAYSAVAIDNAFTAKLPTSAKPFGLKNQYIQLASVAAASPGHFAKEAGLIFDRMLAELAKTNQAVSATLQRERPRFVTGVGAAAADVMTLWLGQRKHNYSKALKAAGASDKDVKDFKYRKRYMRLIRLGYDPEDEARTIAKDDVRYHRPLRLVDLGCPLEKVRAIAENDTKRRHFVKLTTAGCGPLKASALAENEKKYQRYMLRHVKGKSRLAAFVIVKRGRYQQAMRG